MSWSDRKNIFNIDPCSNVRSCDCGPCWRSKMKEKFKQEREAKMKESTKFKVGKYENPLY